jgi:ATP-dependent helicase/nuclease subunit B
VCSCLVGDLSQHWLDSLWLFARVQTLWFDELTTRGEVDPADRRNRLFRHAREALAHGSAGDADRRRGGDERREGIGRPAALRRAAAAGAVVLPDLDCRSMPMRGTSSAAPARAARRRRSGARTR